MDEIPEQPSEDDDILAVVLAAGMGTRMRSELHKSLHRVAGDPILFHVLDAASNAGIAHILLVVGHKADQVRQAAGTGVGYVLQEPQLGTGHALLQAVASLSLIPRRLVVLSADTPLLTADTLREMIEASSGAAIVLLSAHLPDPTGYGRIVRKQDGAVAAIVEEADADAGTRAMKEINSGIYCFDGPWLAANLGGLKKSPTGEYYLTDLVAMAVLQGEVVRAVPAGDPAEVLGVNDRVQLAEADRALRARLCASWMGRGVTIVDPAATYLGKDVVIGPDSVIYPGCHLRGRTVIGEGCEIGPNSIIEDTTLGDRCVVVSSMLEKSKVADQVSIGPFSHLRPGAVIGPSVRLGNFAEVKNSTLGEGVQMHHFSYIGDAELGARTNVGAGTVTCNFDGKRKHRTIVGKDVFLGSDTMLRAPVELGDGAATGAGAVVTKNVPAGMLAVGMPARLRRARAVSMEGGDAEVEKADSSGGEGFGG